MRVILSAEQDPVTNTCFALGLKTVQWTDKEQGARGQGPGAREERSSPGTWNLEPGPSPSASRPRGTEHVFLLDDPLTNPDAEAQMLLAFLRQLNGLLLRVDAENAALAAQLEEAETPEVAVARRALDDVTAPNSSVSHTNVRGPPSQKPRNSLSIIASSSTSRSCGTTSSTASEQRTISLRRGRVVATLKRWLLSRKAASASAYSSSATP